MIQGNAKEAPQEYVDYVLIKNLYHCTPEELDRQDDHITSLHIEFMTLEAKEEALQMKRSEQAARVRKS